MVVAVGGQEVPHVDGLAEVDRDLTAEGVRRGIGEADGEDLYADRCRRFVFDAQGDARRSGFEGAHLAGREARTLGEEGE